MADQRFLINKDEDNKEVHDLKNEQPGCQISEIVNFEYLDFETKEELKDWLDEHPDYDGCEHCLPEFHKK